MKQLHLRCYEILNRIEQLQLHTCEANTVAIQKLQSEYDGIMQVICELNSNPVFMRYTKNPEVIKAIVWEKEDQVLDFNATMQHIHRQIQTPKI